MAEPTVKAAAIEAKDVLTGALKNAGVNSLKLGIGVTVVALTVQVAVIAASAVVGAGAGVVKGVKGTRPIK